MHALDQDGVWPLGGRVERARRIAHDEPRRVPGDQGCAARNRRTGLAPADRKFTTVDEPPGTLNVALYHPARSTRLFQVPVG